MWVLFRYLGLEALVMLIVTSRTLASPFLVLREDGRTSVLPSFYTVKKDLTVAPVSSFLVLRGVARANILTQVDWSKLLERREESYVLDKVGWHKLLKDIAKANRLKGVAGAKRLEADDGADVLDGDVAYFVLWGGSKFVVLRKDVKIVVQKEKVRFDSERALAFYSRTCRVRYEQIVNRNVPVPRVLTASPAFQSGVARALADRRVQLLKRWVVICNTAASCSCRQPGAGGNVRGALPPVQRRAARRIAWNLAIIDALGPTVGGDLSRALCRRLGRGDVGRALLQAAENDRGDVIRQVLFTTFRGRRGCEAWADVIRDVVHRGKREALRYLEDLSGAVFDETAGFDEAVWAACGYELLFMVATVRGNDGVLTALRDTGVATGMDRTFPVRHSARLISFLLGGVRDLDRTLTLLERDWGVPRGTMWQDALIWALDTYNLPLVKFLRQKWGVTDDALCETICSDIQHYYNWMVGYLWDYLSSTLEPELIERIRTASDVFDFGWYGNPEPED